MQRSIRVKADLLRVFYPENDKWKLSVWNIGKEVVEQALLTSKQRPYRNNAILT